MLSTILNLVFARPWYMTTNRTIEASILFGGGNESYRKFCWKYHALESQHEMLLGCTIFFAGLKYQVTKSNSSVFT